MLEQGNPAVFTQGVRNLTFSFFVARRRTLFAVSIFFQTKRLQMSSFPDHYGDAAGQADAGGH